MNRSNIESLLWDTAAIGFGLITGVAIIAIMNQINLFFYPVNNELVLSAESGIGEPFTDRYFLAGRLISILSGSFFAGACSRLVRPELELKMNLFTGIILIGVGVIDFLMFPYPAWYVLAVTLLIIPMVFTGSMFIHKRSVQN